LSDRWRVLPCTPATCHRHHGREPLAQRPRPLAGQASARQQRPRRLLADGAPDPRARCGLRRPLERGFEPARRGDDARPREVCREGRGATGYRTSHEEPLMSTLERAIEIAVQAHAGATDKGGAPYILHPVRVMLRMRTDAERIAAVLHDVVEDTEWTIERLRHEGFSEEVLRAVEALTKRKGEDYFDFCRRARCNEIARKVKLADLTDNMDLKRLTHPITDDYGSSHPQ